MKHLTRDQLQASKEKAVRFVRDVLDDSDRADEITDEDLESYAERKHIEITNPTRRTTRVAKKKSTADLEAELDDLRAENDQLQEENEDLRDQLDTIADIVAPSDEDEEEDGDEGEDSARDYPAGVRRPVAQGSSLGPCPTLPRPHAGV